ncbi:hypothetical protein HUU39_11625 [candidate division KSB1 bacterium]|nr:hypothetical protein [bacterium]NUM65907.1 hypothetical protein [candidate division KSB1 bacterium]
MDSQDLSFSILEVEASSFGNLLHSPYDVDFGTEGEEDSSISVKGLQIRLGDRPVARDLRRLYELGHKQLPHTLAIFDAYDILLITHSIAAIRQERRTPIHALGYEADFLEEDQVYTIELLPQSKFSTSLSGKLESNVDLGVEGHAELPEMTKAVMDSIHFLGGDARLKLSSAIELIGRISFSVMSPLIQAIGIGSSRCNWRFEVEQKPLLGDQIMLQTVLVPRYTEKLAFKIRGYAQIRPKWTKALAMFTTKWLTVECLLSGK